MNRRPFAGFPDHLIDKRVKVEEVKKCATCGKEIAKGSLADTRDWSNYYCDETCERKAYLKQEGRAETVQQDLQGAF